MENKRVTKEDLSGLLGDLVDFYRTALKSSEVDPRILTGAQKLLEMNDIVADTAGTPTGVAPSGTLHDRIKAIKEIEEDAA